MPRVVCAGHVNWDVTLAVDALPAVDGEATIRSRYAGGGGSAANVATALAGLGVDVRLVGAIGDDDAGRRLRDELDARGIDLAGLRTVPGGATTQKYLVVDEDGRVFVLGAEGVNDALEPGDVGPALLEGADHLHLTGQRPETAAALAGYAADVGATVSVDPGRRADDRFLAGVLERVDVRFLNQVESRALGAHATAGDGALVVKYGAGGATVRADGQRYAHPGFAARSVDAAGAGDAFAAGFLAAWLEDADFERALSVGNACGALATERRGARTDVDWARVESVLAAETADG